MAWSDMQQLCALHRPSSLWETWWFAAIAAPPGYWLLLWLVGWPTPAAEQTHETGFLLSVILWQPLVEEACFRGILQGVLLERIQGPTSIPGLTRANLLTSVVFASAHLIAHPWIWVVGIFFVSLVFGHARDRTGSLYPAISLHSYYNAGYFLIVSA